MSFQKGVKEEYFEWLYECVCKGRAHEKISYRKLFNHLHQIEFIFHLLRDENRAADGVDLRYRFAIDRYEDSIEEIMYILDGPCSVLEMMIALAIRCEESIMDNTGFGDRTGQWFWDMMSNLGIGRMTDEMFNEEFVDDIIYTFLDRQYEPDGRGGLFYIRDCQDDLRDIEIWSQLCWYLDKFV